MGKGMIKIGKYYYRNLWSYILVEIFRQSPAYIKDHSFQSVKFEAVDKGFGEVEYKKIWNSIKKEVTNGKR